MIGEIDERQQLDLFRPMLAYFIDLDYELVLLSDKIRLTRTSRLLVITSIETHMRAKLLNHYSTKIKYKSLIL